MSPSPASPSDPAAWVRGPKPVRQSPSRAAAAVPGDGSVPGAAEGADNTVQPTRSTSGGPVRTDGPAVPGRRPARRRPPAPAADPPWAEPKRPVPGRGRSRDEVGWVKAHGGAGATSLAESLGGVDVGARWPEPGRGEPRRIVLVGRTSAHGLRAVSRALGALSEGNAPKGLDLLGVVLVADAPGRLPLSLLRRIRIIRSVTRVHRVPWIPAWRVGGEPTYLPRQLGALAELVGTGPGADGEGRMS